MLWQQDFDRLSPAMSLKPLERKTVELKETRNGLSLDDRRSPSHREAGTASERSQSWLQMFQGRTGPSEEWLMGRELSSKREAG